MTSAAARAGTPAVTLVTGASSGIGLATALLAARRGDHLVLVARGERSLRETAQTCESAGAASARVAPADVGDDEAVARVVAETVERHGRLDVVVHAAGVVAYGRAEEVPTEVFDGVLRTNLLGSMNIARHVVPQLRRQREGSLVLVGSVVGHVTAPLMSPYAVSKWGIRALVRHLRVENRDLPGVRIGYAAPGGVDTPIYTQGASALGTPGRPPPPVATPERTARQILRRARHPWLPAQLTASNHLLRLGHAALPAVYDRIVTPTLRLVALDETRDVDSPRGNVLASRPAGNRLHGDQGPALAGIAANLRARRR